MHHCHTSFDELSRFQFHITKATRRIRSHSSHSSLGTIAECAGARIFYALMAFNCSYNSMAHCQSPIHTSSFPTLQSHPLIFTNFFGQHPFLFSSSCFPLTQKRRRQCCLKTRAAAVNLDSGNGAVSVALEVNKPQSSTGVVSYGRQYFPLAAVVGQVSSFLLYESRMRKLH